ncbi:cbb3-type cytochrome c oxidase subunit I [Roseomonas sp. NAR14]|uniref:Cbb3-type cytochrome c oxidase subunit I n=1 Tax=Roseomonas acroporae TaxID=2937791 RepID=A0A9X2BYM2_9PROT|nr:cbb3-type cytochrome c oxidase subunit I [Roseomonas acroporae]MCK8787079.1 cbb3-type cytochrome c oxidase subunit I [Roseomonas acroporae]
MSGITADDAMAEAPQERQGDSYLTAETGLASWLLTTDHKRVALLYAAALTAFFFIGGAAAVLIRLELFTPASDLVSAEGYNRLFTLHGLVMVWFFLVPAIPNTLGNFLLPLMIGARDLAFPRLNLFSWYLFMGAGLLLLAALLLGGVDTGWTFYTPFSTGYAHSNVLLAALAVVLVGFSSVATGVNMLATVHLLRAPGMGWFRLPLLVWSIYGTALVMVLATPVLAAALLLVVAERAFGLPIFDPRQGGDPLLFQHLFWFYSHPAVYIMILPAFGVVSEIVPCFARRRIFGYTFMVYAILMIALLGFLVWGHHMFVSGQSLYASLVFSFLSFVIAVPSAIKVFNWSFTLYRGQISFQAPMLYALGFIGLFTLGGLTGLVLASVPVNRHVTDTYYVVAHFHFIMVGGAVTALYGGLHFWWPKITGRMPPDGWARFAAVLMFFGFSFTFFPMFVMGFLGMPRRYASYPPEFQVWHVLASAGAVLLAAAYLLPMGYLAWSLVRGRRAGDDPWNATGLEWRTASPPPRDNFRVPPIVEEAAYLYHPRHEGPRHEEQEPHRDQGGGT